MLKQIKNTKGFSLIELLVVIVIIGILSTGAVSYFTSARSKARDSVRQSTAAQIGQVVLAEVLEDNDYEGLTEGAAGTLANLLTTEFGSIPGDPTDYRYILVGSSTSADYAVFYWSEGDGAPAYVGSDTAGAVPTYDVDDLSSETAAITDVDPAVAGYVQAVIDVNSTDKVAIVGAT